MAATASGPTGPKLNHIGLPVIEYRGGKTTLCAGCGHNAISERIIDAMFEMGVEPERVMKMSGIGCSSKRAELKSTPCVTLVLRSRASAP